MSSKYSTAAAVLMFVAVFLYALQFYFNLGSEVSPDPEQWGQFGDYVGGVLNPLLSFVSILLIVKSLSLQVEANKSSEKGEKTRSFESLFFNIIERQNKSFELFEITESGVVFRGDKAVRIIEDRLDLIPYGAEHDAMVRGVLSVADEHDAVFGLARSFYLSVKIVSEKITEKNGFSSEDRLSQYRLLISFSDFAYLRVVMICMRYLDYKSVEYLKNNKEFLAVMSEVGLDYLAY